LLDATSRPADDCALRRELPTGTVTLLFSDVEGSTTLLHELGAGAYADVLAEHRRIVRAACIAEGGVEVCERDGVYLRCRIPSAFP
jgi:class 3 adenylate cyclase